MMERDREDDEMEIINPYSSYSGSYNPYAITDYYGQKVHTIVRDCVIFSEMSAQNTNCTWSQTHLTLKCKSVSLTGKELIFMMIIWLID